MNGPQIIDLTSEEQPVELPHGPVTATTCHTIKSLKVICGQERHPRVSYSREEPGKGSHEGTLNVVSPDAVQIDAGVCRGGSGHGAARPVGCQAGGGLPFWQEREVKRRVANRNPSAWLALSVKSLSVPGRLCILQPSIKTNAHLQ